MTEIDLVGSLQRAMVQAGSEWTAQPSRLRRRLDEVLGPDARSHRSQVHLVIVAAEEKVPVRLKRNGWSPEERDDLTTALADARGWTRQAAEWSVVTWAAALGLTDERPAPLVPVSRPAAAMPVEEALVTDFPVDPAVPETVVPETVLPVDTAPPVEATVLPDVGTVLPDPPEAPEPAASPSPEPSPEPALAAVVVPVPRGPRADIVPTAELPTKNTKAFVKRATACLGHDVDVAYEVRTGFNPGVLLGVSLVTGIVGVLLAPTPVGIALLVVCSLLLTSVRMTGKVLALRGDDVWLMDNAWFSTKLKPPMITATRDEIDFAGGSPFNSISLRGTRLWFFLNSAGAAKAIPTHGPLEGVS